MAGVRLGLRCAAALLLAAQLSACASAPATRPAGTPVAQAPPVNGGTPVEISAPPLSRTTRLGNVLEPASLAHTGLTGIYPLAHPQSAFAARALLAGAADRTLDIQNYIWRADETGYLLFEALWQAAERGVQVRLLLDDNNTAGLDQTLVALDTHPRIEVRLYNPMSYRRFRLLNFITDFNRANRRMHNKSFTVDGQATILGGRNVGNEYFGEGEDVLFEDLDVLAVGAAPPAVAKSFELYWNSPSAQPVKQLVKADADAAAKLLQRFEVTRNSERATAYLKSLHEDPLVRDLLDGKLPLTWSKAQFVVDHPSKTLGEGQEKEVLLLAEMLPELGYPKRSFDLVSPYLVPGKQGTAELAALVKHGVRVRILTNSLAATDVAAVHAGYAKHRVELLRAGVQIYELRPAAGQQRGSGFGGSSASSLHAKTFSLDDSRLFVGSFNFDPRSAYLNTELGLIIDSPELARQLGDVFDRVVPQAAYEVRLTPEGALQWLERTESGLVVHDREPEATATRLAMVFLLSLLPIEWML